MMNRLLAISLFKWGLTVLVVGLIGCGEEAPTAPQPKSTSKKISVGSTAAPTTPETQQKKAPVQAQPAAAEETTASAELPTAETSELIKASLQIAGTYDPEGRFDPFEPLFKEQPTVEEEPPDKDKRKKRKPQTPLERVALSQLKVTAIIRSPSGNRALVEDASGKGYVVQKGTYIGLNAGQVIEIDKDRIVVEEEIESVMGELRIENSELKLQKPAGEF